MQLFPKKLTRDLKAEFYGKVSTNELLLSPFFTSLTFLCFSFTSEIHFIVERTPGFSAGAHCRAAKQERAGHGPHARSHSEVCG